MDQSALLAFSAATVAQAFFTAQLLFLRSTQRQVYLPMGIFLVSLGVLLSWPIVSMFVPQLLSLAIVFSLPALLLLGPSLWFYVEGLTAETPWRFRHEQRRHFLLFGFGLVTALVAICLPYELREALMVRGEEAGFDSVSGPVRFITATVALGAFVLILIWVVQSTYYSIKITRHIAHYRRRLRDVFATTDSRELQWLSWLLFAVGAVWLVTAINLVADNIFEITIISRTLTRVLIFIMVWSLSLWVLRQKPGFEQLYAIQKNDNMQAQQEQKYERSALTPEYSEQIAFKIKKAVMEEKLYLDSSLSLQQLAKHISVSPNYISQTLNETLGMSFFDYVNNHRVEAAKVLLVESADTVLDVAMNVGFNAKSSFYSAFKKVTGTTPSEFRKAGKA